jgi:DNA-directed RNA polymerase subunit RPC12/RpoP
MTRRYICPSCNEKTGVDVVYGMPSEELAKQAELGEVALGGCVIEPNQPDYRCVSCGFEWDKTRQFEEAKQRWLKEDVKGRSWTQMMDDNDNKQVPMSDEYLAMWKKAEKDYDEGAD